MKKTKLETTPYEGNVTELQFLGAVVMNTFAIMKYWLIGASMSKFHIYESAVNFYIYLCLVRCAVSHLQFLFCIYQLCVGHMHVLQDTLRTCPYIKRSVYF